LFTVEPGGGLELVDDVAVRAHRQLRPVPELVSHMEDGASLVQEQGRERVAQAVVGDVLEAMEAATAYDAASLDAPGPGGDGDDGWTIGDSVGSHKRGYELAEIGEALGRTIKAMPDRERTILRLRFDHDLTQAEIAKRVGISQMHVSRLLRRSLDRLHAAGNDLPTPPRSGRRNSSRNHRIGAGSASGGWDSVWRPMSPVAALVAGPSGR
jgi:RNA polymerase sigma factor (sigma-70 family)